MIKNKKILIVTECFYPEEFRINDIFFSWKDKGYEIDVLTLAPTYPLGRIFPGYKNSIFKKEKFKDMNIYRVRAVTGYKDSPFKKILKYLNFMILGSICAIFIGRKYDYVFGFNMSALTNMLPAIIIKKIYKKPTTLWVQDIWPDSLYAYGFKKSKLFSTVVDSFIKFIYQNTDNIAISCRGFKEKLSSYIKDNSLVFHYLPNWAEELKNNSINGDIHHEDEITNFTFAGNIGKLQNLENIIKAYGLLSDEYQKKSQFNIIGDGSNLENLKLTAKDNSKIVFHGRKQSSMMADYYAKSDFLIISLIGEPIFSSIVPSKTQTYIAAKKPILAIINGDTADIVRDNNLGLCANPSNISEISRLLEKCIDMSKSERKKFISQNDYLLSTLFNREEIIDSLLKIVTKRID